MLDVTQSAVVGPSDPSAQERQAICMLIEEVEKRIQIRWEQKKRANPSDTSAILVRRLAEAGGAPHEGYQIRVEAGELPRVSVIGNDTRGILFGIGHLLRLLRMSPGRAMLPADIDIVTAPRYPLRGHQLGYRDKTNSYCGWDLRQWEQYIRDLVVFGANAIELIPPRSDDRADSVHFPLPPLPTMVGMSEIADRYGIDVWIWFPALDKDYSDPATVEFALNEWEQVFEALPRIDAIFVPGGDPGCTPPPLLMRLLERQMENLHRHHPGAEMWISPQGFDQDRMETFLSILRAESSDWLAGIVFGPWVHIPLDQFRQIIPERYPIRHYPDITHTISCQYPPDDWDIAYALTEGREPINPRPVDQAAIFHHTQPYTCGFLTYSEGCNDDVNKAVWSGLGWDPGQQVVEILREYSRYFIGKAYTDAFTQGLLALERNWKGPLATNTGVNITLQQFQQMEREASPHVLKNWRFQQALYRAYYDAYVRARLLHEMSLEERVMSLLRRAPQIGTMRATAEAERTLDETVLSPVAPDLRQRLFQLAEALFQSIHMQLSVPFYQAQEEVRGGNLDGVDYPLNDAPWFKAQFREIRELKDESERLERLQAILDWNNPGPGGFYDDMSLPSSHVAGKLPYEQGPGFLRSPVRKFSYRKSPEPWRRTWRCTMGTLQDTPFEMCYTGLDPEMHYRLRVVYSDHFPQIPVRLEANDGIEVHPWLLKRTPRGLMEFEIPQEATQGGTLTLRWFREPGHGGSGTGCGVSEVWLITDSGCRP